MRTYFQSALIALFLSIALINSQCVADQITTTQQQLFDAAWGGDLAKVRQLLASGISAKIRRTDGQTPLHLACSAGHRQTAAALLEAGAELNAKDNNGKTALDLARAAGHDGLSKFLLEHGAAAGDAPQIQTAASEPNDASASPAAANNQRGLNPSLKFKTLAVFQAEIGEPAVLLDAENICFFAPKRREREAAIIFDYLVKAYDALYAMVGVHTEYKVAVYAFPHGNAHGWGGTSNCSIEYDDANLDLDSKEEWVKYRVPHVSGYIEELAHNFVHATKAQFGWEMVGWSIGAEACLQVAPNPSYLEQLRATREKQQDTYLRYIQNNFALPADVPPNQCDRVHAWILRQYYVQYGPNFWRDFFSEIRKQAEPLRAAINAGNDDAIRNARYRITLECFDRLPGLNFKQNLERIGISTVVDVKSLHPETAGWNRRLTQQ